MENIYDIKSDGISKINGGVYKNIKMNGISTILGDVKAEDMEMKGLTKVKGNVKGKEIKSKGTISVEGDIELEEKITINGIAKIDGNLMGREVCMEGAIKVGKTLNADKIEMKICGKSTVNEIECSNLKIEIDQHDSGSIKKFIYPTRFRCQSIEGDNISIEGVECDTIKGDSVVIKSDCNVECVEYSKNIYIDEKSKVNKVIRL